LESDELGRIFFPLQKVFGISLCSFKIKIITTQFYSPYLIMHKFTVLEEMRGVARATHPRLFGGNHLGECPYIE